MSDHPGFDTLLRYGGGELTGLEEELAKSHVDECPQCRLEVVRLRDALAHTDQAPEASVSQLFERIQVWRTTATDGDELLRLVSEELAAYVGRSGAQALLDRVSKNGEDLFAVIEPVLAMFLGNEAANRLIDRIIERSVTGA